MPFYHATYLERLPSILKLGLRPGHERNFPDAEPGVYLTTEPAIAIMMLIDHYLEAGDTEITPPQQLERIRVIVIDDSRVDPARLRGDPQAPEGYHDTIMIYDGIVDVTNMPVLPVSAFDGA